jgi:transposase
MPQEFGPWPTVHNRFRQWRDAGVFEALLEGLIADAAKRDEVDLSLVSVDSTTVRAHHDAAGMHLDAGVLTALEKAAAASEGAAHPVAAQVPIVVKTPNTTGSGGASAELKLAAEPADNDDVAHFRRESTVLPGGRRVHGETTFFA